MNVPNKIAKTLKLANGVMEAVFILQVIGIVASGILILLTPLYLALGRRSVTILLGLTSLGATCFGFVAVVETAIMFSIKSIVNEIGEGLGIEAYSGGKFVALLWVNFLVIFLSSILWFLLWHDTKYAKRDNAPKPLALAQTADSDAAQRKPLMRL